MSNVLFRNRLIAKIKAAKAEYDNSLPLEHPYMKGRVREIVLQNLIAPILPQDFQIGNGKITDKNGRMSKETDLIIYSNKLIPPILYSERLGAFPIDSCVATIEVKSTLTASEIGNAIKNADALRKLEYSSGKFSSVGKPLSHRIGVVTRSLFAFQSDISVKDELERYGEKDHNYKTSPKIKAFCIMGKGTWCFNHDNRKWTRIKPTDDYDEVISFLTLIIIDNLYSVLESRGRPKIGPYIAG